MALYLASALPAATTSSVEIAIDAAAHRTIFSSMRSSSLGSLAGCREVASAKKFVFPAQWEMEKFHMEHLCLSRKSLGFSTVSRDLSPSSRTRGLWSVATMSLSQPMVKNLVWSRAHATARASPSTGA